MTQKLNVAGILKKKNENLRLMKKQFLSSKVKSIQCDHGSKFISSKVKTILSEHGIAIHPSTPSIPQRNGIAEKNRRIVSAAHVLRSHWGIAVNHVTLLCNIKPQKHRSKTN